MGTGQAPPDPEVVFVNRVPVQGLKFVTGQFNPVDQQQNLPLESTQNGNIFTDRFNAQLSWYVPGYQLAPDIDAGFSFSAGAKGIDASGNPYYQAAITLTLDKIEPPDVTAYRTANPTQQLQEIPLTSITATLATSANDPQTGSVQQIVYNAAVAADANGNLTLTFTAILGAQVLVAYSNLQSGGATIALSAQFEVWRVLRFVPPIINRPPIQRPPIGVIQRPPTGVTQRPPTGVTQRPIGIGVGRPPILPKLEIEGGPVRPIFPIRPIPTPTPTPPQTTYTTASDPFTLSFSLDQKYAAPGYARSYTITDSNGVRPIININDLKNFDVTQSEYTQFTALRDISSQFPSFSRLYIGGLSRTIVAIPAAYGIVRSKDGTGAVCEALLDSTAGGSGAAKFQFAFVLGPVVSPFDLFALQAALAANPQSQNCTLTLPQVLDTSQPMSLATPFQSSVSYTAGQLPSTFQLDVVISDGSVAGSAVANANLFLKQLSPTVATYLSGSFGVLLDDAYPHPVIASVVLSLHDTSGSDDEISSIVAADGSSIELVNPSPLDLEVSRYAIVSGNSAPPETLNQKLPSQQSITLSDKATSSSPVLLVDRTLALENPFTKQALQRYVSFITQDVQNVNYQIGVQAGFLFDTMGIAEIDIVITIPSLPSVSIPNSTLTALNLASNTVITLPIQNAITTLPAVIAFTVKAAAATETAVQFTENNDFVDQPVYVLQASSIPPFAAIPLQS